MNVLVLNCGSSSVKFQIIETDSDLIEQDADRRLAEGSVDRIGSQALITFHSHGQIPEKRTTPIADYRQALEVILNWAASPESGIDSEIHAVGHRIVHGGEDFRRSLLIDARVIAGIEDCVELAPLHNPAQLKGIQAVTEFFEHAIPQVAVFDTAFHTTMLESAYLYGIPYHYYRRYKIRRYGFHGTSHRYVAYRYRHLQQIPREQVKIITLHLGNGCSACAIKEGRSVNTSMGLTPLEGLLMGTRCGDIDPSIIEFLAQKEGMSVSEILELLNKQSGLLGISGLSSDMRKLLQQENQNPRAGLAIHIFCNRIKGYIGRYLAEMGGADALIFTGGIGENSTRIRERICAGLEFLGLALDRSRNEELAGGQTGEISAPESRLRAFVIPTDEELLIARDTVRVIQADKQE